MNGSFLARVESVMNNSSAATVRSPAAHLGQWDLVIRECEDGYSSSIYEYDNDIGVRDQIQRLLDAPEFQQYAELGEFRREVDNIDARFRAILRPVVEVKADSPYWWRRGVLASAGREYADDVEALYGVHIDVPQS